MASTESGLGERQAAILRAIVREYIRTGEPVGSKYLVDRARLRLSSATVRNEMARLEEMGFLAQPHTSAGRIPSDRAYRFVVDEIKQPRALAEGQRRALEAEFAPEAASFDELLHRATDVVARFTRHAAAVLARRARPARLRRLELFPMGVRMAMLVLIADNGRVEQRFLPMDPRITEPDLDAIAKRLGGSLQDSTLDESMKTLDAEIAKAQPAERSLLDDIMSSMRALQEAGEEMAVGGVANLAGEDDFQREELHRLYEALEHQTQVLQLLAGALGPVSVRIGSEVPSEDFQSCSIVVASFGPEGAHGSVGVIGPTRMDYDRVIATADAVAHLLEGSLGGSNPEPS
ncbi:MAG: heat-inducible transcriptional repressor HrcA [Actinobacteria bacterium]|nr:heat-inducible transcriptional repressor HrcA [Actinomycetota bacterium]